MPSTQRTEGTAIAAMVLGIVGVVVFPLIPSIIALLMGRYARQKIQLMPGLGGEGMATAGIVLGWVGIAWGIILIIIVANVANSPPDFVPSFEIP